MPNYENYQEQEDTETIEFHVSFLQSLLPFLSEKGIRSSRNLAVVRGQKHISEALWKISEGNRLRVRQYNLRFYSEESHRSARKRGSISAAESGRNHEHVIPRALLAERLLENRENPSAIARVARCSVGCVVTTREHRALPDDPWYGIDPAVDPWRRYRLARVRVWDRLVKGWVNLEEDVWKFPVTSSVEGKKSQGLWVAD